MVLDFERRKGKKCDKKRSNGGTSFSELVQRRGPSADTRARVGKKKKIMGNRWKERGVSFRWDKEGTKTWGNEKGGGDWE